MKTPWRILLLCALPGTAAAAPQEMTEGLHSESERVELSPGSEIELTISAGNPAALRAVNVRSIQLDDVN